MQVTCLIGRCFFFLVLGSTCGRPPAVAGPRETSVDPVVEKYAQACELEAKDCDSLVNEAIRRSDPYFENLNRAAAAALQGCTVAFGDWEVCKHFVAVAANLQVEGIGIEYREYAQKLARCRGAELFYIAIKDSGEIDYLSAEAAIKVFSMSCAPLEDSQSCSQIFAFAKIMKSETVVRETLAQLKDRCRPSWSATGRSPACKLYERMRNRI